MDEWMMGGIEGKSKEGRKQRRNTIQRIVCQALGKLDYSQTKINSVLSNHTESLNELKV